MHTLRQRKRSMHEHVMVGSVMFDPLCRVQQELSMLPGFSCAQSSPGNVLNQVRNSSSPPAATSYPSGQPPSWETNPQRGSPSPPSDSSFIAADDDPADAAAADNGYESTVEGPVEAAGYGALSAQEEETEQRSAVTSTTDESAAADMKAAKASKDHASLSDGDSGIQGEFPESLSAEPRTKAAVARPEAAVAAVARPEAFQDRVQSAPGGSGILSEYLKRMHFSKETPLQGPLPAPAPPQDVSAQVSLPRRWTKTYSFPDGQSPLLLQLLRVLA